METIEQRKDEIVRRTIENIKHETATGRVVLSERVIASDRFLTAAVAVLESGAHGVTVRRERGDVIMERTDAINQTEGSR